MTIETKPWDAADVLNTPADIAAYLDAWLEDGTPEELLRALNTRHQPRSHVSGAKRQRQSDTEHAGARAESVGRAAGGGGMMSMT